MRGDACKPLIARLGNAECMTKSSGLKWPIDYVLYYLALWEALLAAEWWINASVCLSVGRIKLTIGVVAPRFLGEVLCPEFPLRSLRFEGRTDQSVKDDLFRLPRRRLLYFNGPLDTLQTLPTRVPADTKEFQSRNGFTFPVTALIVGFPQITLPPSPSA